MSRLKNGGSIEIIRSVSEINHLCGPPATQYHTISTPWGLEDEFVCSEVLRFFLEDNRSGDSDVCQA